MPKSPALSPYRAAMLLPLRHPRSDENAALLSQPALGIEVTEPELAALCRLGNIDPQHDGQAYGSAAITAALDWPLPPPSSLLVTIRPDADALGAMALLGLRHNGVDINWQLRDRVNSIARWDSFLIGSWERWIASQPAMAKQIDIGTVDPRPVDIRVLAMLAQNRLRSLTEKVQILGQWLQFGDLPGGAHDAVTAAEAARITAWNSGEVVIGRTIDSRVVTMRSMRSDTLIFAYRFAPVVVAEGLVDGRRKLTIAQFEPGWVDLGAVREILSSVERGWGGSATIIGSPQGAACRLSIPEVTSAVLAARRAGNAPQPSH